MERNQSSQNKRKIFFQENQKYWNALLDIFVSAVRYTKSSSEQQRSVYFVNFKDYRIDQWYQMIKPADTYLTGLHFCAFIGVNLCHSNANHKHIAHWSLETDLLQQSYSFYFRSNVSVDDSPFKISQEEANKEVHNSAAPGPDGPLPETLNTWHYVGSAWLPAKSFLWVISIVLS